MNAAKTIVMVIDDEEAVEELIEAFVEQKGYTHASFNDPVEALHYFEADNEHICFVVMDLTMPRMSGLDLAREMMEVNPSTPIVLITGQLDPQIPDEIASRLHRVLHKPFTKSELLQAVESAGVCVLTGGEDVSSRTR